MQTELYLEEITGEEDVAQPTIHTPKKCLVYKLKEKAMCALQNRSTKIENSDFLETE